MKTLISLFWVVATSMLLSGCVDERMMAQMNMMQHLTKEPDLPTWHSQREQIIEKSGDRVFDYDFNRVFDSLIVALQSMGLTLDRMEKQSGYIAARGQFLPPERDKQLRSEELTAWCIAKGYDPSLLECRGAYQMDPMSAGIMQMLGKTLTISLVKQSEKQTKVKLRFNGVYYPPTLEESYVVIWPKLEKEIFIDNQPNGADPEMRIN